MRHSALLWTLIALAGCAAAWPRSGVPRVEVEGEEEGMEMGPPPPGYWRIVGDGVPGWRPEDMHRGAPDGPITWSRLGPRPIRNEYWSGTANASGRVVSIAPHPTDANTCYIASASGGVWKTTDGGLNWTPLTDELSNLNHGAITLDPSDPNVVYVGTGEYTTSSGGDGLFRSMDAGANWTRIATTSQVGSNVSKVAIDPTNPQAIHVTGSSGYARSTNGGSSWTFGLAGAASDLLVNPTDPQTVFVGRANDGVYRSTNGGGTFTRLSGGLPSTGVRRVVLAMARSNPSVVYCAITNTNSGLLGMYKTTDGGNTWALLSATPDFPSPQAWYDCCVAVEPTDENTVYAGGVFPAYAVAGIIKTTNGGASWTDITVRPGGQVHPDEHTLAFGAGAPAVLWVGNDGGVWKSTNAGSSWTNCNATLEVTQHYAIALDPTNPGKVAAGTQDNGSVARDLLTDAWPQTVAGDGGFCAVDFNTPTRRYFTYVYLTIFRLNGTSQSNITGPWSSDPANFISPLVMDPNTPTTLLGGTNRVWRTTNASSSPPTWTAISTSIVAGSGTLNAIAVARGFSNTIYTGSSGGKVFVTTDASMWNDRSVGLPTGQISDIILSPADPATAYVAFSNSSGPRVLRTINSGMNWTDVTGALPSGVRAKALEVDWRFSPPDLYVGTGAGIYWSFNGGQTWTKDGTDLPNVNIGDLAIDPVRNTITAGTYGRGAWRANLRTPSACYANCDGSTTLPLLNVNDFVCFQSRFAAADPYADCDQNSTLNVNDFVCFQAAFAAGCP
jgi:photosystem II stability/assembly factor-like uncharacterized protein